MRLKGRDRNKSCPCGSGKRVKRCCGRPAHTPRIPVARSRHTKPRDVEAYTLSVPPADEGFDEHEHRDWLGQGWTFPALTDEGKLPLFRSSESAAEFADRNCPDDPVIVLACSEGQLEAFERDYETEWME